MQRFRVILVEDRPIYKLYFENMIRESDRYELVSTELNMQDALKRGIDNRIDMVLMEAANKNGDMNFAAAKICKKEYPYIRIVVMASSPDCTYFRQAKESGVDSFFYIEKQKESVLTVMDYTMDGGNIWPDFQISVKIGRIESRQFTEKELHILREVAKGYSNKEIANEMHISYYTVRDYIKSMLEKTGLRSRTELAVEAVSSGLITLGKSSELFLEAR